MGQDIDHALKNWDFKPGVVQARVIQATGGRQVLQVRADLGVLQMELTGRPDGQRPHGHETYLSYLRELADTAERAEEPFTLNPEQCIEADREFFQFYQRRIGFLTIGSYDRAVRDADHTLAFMDFVKRHGPNADYIAAHEQYRPFVLFHRSLAAADAALARQQPETALDELQAGLALLRRFFAEHELEDRFEEDAMVQELRRKAAIIRDEHAIGQTIKERLAEAVAAEDYETAARLRDELRKRG